jgi:RHS repeat-associated protein
VTSLLHIRRKFTGKERDIESGLDNFGARYDNSALGRFMTPDWAAKPTTVPYAKFGDPQSLNLYAYVGNGPLNRVDTGGHLFTTPMLMAMAEDAEADYACGWCTSQPSPASDGHANGTDPASTAQTGQSQPDGSAQNLDSSADAAKSSAQRSGAVSSTKVGGVWVNAYGGTAAQRTDELAAFSQDLTHSERGKDMLKALEGRKSGLFGLWGSPKPFDIIQMASGGSYSYAGGQAIMLDYHDVGAAYTSAHGGGTYSLQRIFAHELGHAAMGNLDNGPGQMNNVNWNENPVMRQLGDFNDRTAY